MNDSSRHIFTIVILSFGLLMLLSVLPWSSLTGNVIKDFNLFEDLFPSEQATMNSSIPVDPELQALASGTESDAVNSGSGLTMLADSLACDSAAADTVVVEMPVIADEAPRADDGTVLIENYTGTERPLERFRHALSQTAQRRVRVAVLGDSYIEGDIFCQNLRDLLQTRYGGSGVGFMAMHSDFPGFRRTVRQSGSGWTMHDIRNMSGRDTLRTLSGDYAKASGAAKARYDAAKAFDGNRLWEHSSFVFVSPDSGTVTLTASDGIPYSFEVGASPRPQMLSLPASTSSFTIESNISGLVGLGAYLDGNIGVQVDCMSVRGNSGMGLRSLRRDLCLAMAQWADYDLIILEFGMNAISPDQTNYAGYGQAMVKAVDRVRACFPNADILIMGVGDRGSKNGASVVSLPAAAALAREQRKMAHKAGAHYWDTRAAMGGDGAIADWRKRKLVNADYIHLNHEGGAELASLFDKALQAALHE